MGLGVIQLSGKYGISSGSFEEHCFPHLFLFFVSFCGLSGLLGSLHISSAVRLFEVSACLFSTELNDMTYS